MQIHFVTGKGGVGKTTWAYVLGSRLASQGKRTLVVELGETSSLGTLLDIPGVSYQPVSVKNGLSLAVWSGPECLREYARHLLKIDPLVNLLFDNKVTRSLINVAPALQELAILGKVTSGPPRNVGPPIPFDAIVVDAYASGHFLNLLRAPSAMSAAIPIGPMGVQSRSILTVVRSSLCQYHVVSLLEDLSMLETLELQKTLHKEFGIQPHLVLNKKKWFADQRGTGLAEKMNQLHDNEVGIAKQLKRAPWQSVQEAPMVWSSTPRVIFEGLEASSV